jgi:ornithine carbamoyltransferase
MKKDFLRILDLTAAELVALLDRADALKAGGYGKGRLPLKGKTLAMIFQKASTRTRVSFEVAMTRLGGHAIFLSPSDTQIGRGEPIRDTARVLSRYCDAVMIRTFAHADVEEFARWATVPVVNGLTDDHHPCQILADLQAVRERGIDLRKMKAAWVGDGNNVAASWIEAACLLGFRLSVACPKGYAPSRAVLDEAHRAGRGTVEVVGDPVEAVKGADVVVTDVWTSMGQEAEGAKRLAAFKGYQVNAELLSGASRKAVVLHCLPAHRGEEITDDVFEGPRSAILDEAENRLHAQAALLEKLLRNRATRG